jgi:hypothetical protein
MKVKSAMPSKTVSAPPTTRGSKRSCPPRITQAMPTGNAIAPAC